MLQLCCLLCLAVLTARASADVACASSIYIDGDANPKLFTSQTQHTLQDDAIRFCQQFSISDTDCIKIMEYHSAECPDSHVEGTADEEPLPPMHTSNSTLDMADAFSRVYAERYWGDEGLGSGTGSSLERTLAVAEYLREAIPRLGVTSLLDAPCGAMLWMPPVLRSVQKDLMLIHSHSLFSYYGIDVVPDLIARHKIDFAAETSWRFEAKDMSGPEGFDKAYDLVLARDVFVHLSSKRIRCALNNLIRSKSTYLLTTSYPHIQKNTEHIFLHHKLGQGQLNDGSYREVNLNLAPYSLGQPIEFVQEMSRIVGLWDLRKIPLYLDEQGSILICQ
jgi:hypothetical protein